MQDRMKFVSTYFSIHKYFSSKQYMPFSYEECAGSMVQKSNCAAGKDAHSKLRKKECASNMDHDQRLSSTDGCTNQVKMEESA